MHPARLLLLLLPVAVIGATADVDRPVFVKATCSAPGNYTDSSPFGKNVAELLSALSTPPPATVDNYWWFRSHTVGTAPDQVSGLAVCYADADAERCLDCINSASSTWFSGLCDHSRNVGFLSSVGCAIRYADAPFFGSADSGADARLILRSDFLAFDAAGMREARRELLSQLAERAGGDALRFATGSQGIKDAVSGGVWQVMYGMAQCTRDLPRSECSSCLIDLLAVMYGESITNSTSASVMGLSCYLMYQMNEPINFIAGMVAVPPAAPPAEPPTGSAAASPAARPVSPKTTVIVALAVAAVTLFSVGP
ncbi:cysteine-rich repeat secretory protein 38-like [Setaria italica]|uniref:cysteine-rich repeat secretory protein 38-like n=1 Tax=Setaria italica TaxID=4555 RepID=UPI00064866B2|nr:cysteine-rich repeat secretory protein 38-like [Setaria italica]